VPLDEIAARAGVGAGTVYRHFPTKEALFEAVVTARVVDLAADARERAWAADPGAAFFGLLARIGDEAIAKRDLPEAIAIPGPLQEELHAALGVVLRRAQRAGAVRDDIDTPDLIAVFKAATAGLRDAPGDAVRRKRLFDVMTDGLRPRAPGDGRLESRIDVDLGSRAGIEAAVERLDGPVEADDDVHQRPRVHAAVRVVRDRGREPGRRAEDADRRDVVEHQVPAVHEARFSGNPDVDHPAGRLDVSQGEGGDRRVARAVDDRVVAPRRRVA
jgi:AcrR family transcriptional regulator